MTKPNILFVMTDQQRWDAMGCSADWVRTPTLDRIAREGVRFTQCITTTPICIPARVTLATGDTRTTTPCGTTWTTSCRPRRPLGCAPLRDLGYRTSLFGKTHLHPHRGDLRECEHLLNAYGLDDVDEIGGPRASAHVMSHMTARWQEKGLLDAYRADFAERFANKPTSFVRPRCPWKITPTSTWVSGRSATSRATSAINRGFAGSVSAARTNLWDAPEPYASMYSPEAMPAPVPRAPDDHPRPQGWLDYHMARSTPRFDPGDQAAMRANYAGNVTLIDDQIGELVQVIEERGELHNTVIAFTSDHGEMNGDWDLIYKVNFLDGALRVPMLFRTPHTTGSVSEALVENCDLGPTLVELAGGDWSIVSSRVHSFRSWRTGTPRIVTTPFRSSAASSC